MSQHKTEEKKQKKSEKKISKKDEEESKLEKEIDSEKIIKIIKIKKPIQKIDETQFQTFMQASVDSFSPSLEKVAHSPETIFFTQTPQQSSSNENSQNNNEPFNYTSNIQQENEIKYVSSSAKGAPLETIDFSQVGTQQRDIHRDFFMSSQEAKSNSMNVETYEPVKRIDTENVGRESPFEKDKKKYDPNLPK